MPHGADLRYAGTAELRKSERGVDRGGMPLEEVSHHLGVVLREVGTHDRDAHDELAPVYGSAGDLNATYMVITRNPGSVKIKSNASIKFVADANVYDSAYWTFVSPDGGEYDLAYFQAHFIYSSISGAYDTTLHINAVDGYMDGWGAYCTFSFKGQTAVTSTAWINITDNR